MSKRNDLAKLAKLLPTPDEIEGILDSLREDSDTAAAITGAALAEAKLEELLRAKFRVSDKKLMQSIFENRGPLSDFHSKILVAEATGVITGAMAAELQIVRAVRNAFAHAKRPLSFTMPTVDAKIRASGLLSPIDQLPPPHPSQRRGLPSTKGAYLLMVRILLIIFNGIEMHAGLAREAIDSALAESPPDKKGGQL